MARMKPSAGNPAHVIQRLRLFAEKSLGFIQDTILGGFFNGIATLRKNCIVKK